MKALSICLITGILCLLFPTCRKQAASTETPQTLLISNAKAWFTAQVENSGPVNQDNYTALQPKTLLWDQAYVVPLSIGKGIVVPVQFKNNLLVKTPYGGNRSYNLNGFTKLLVYADTKQQYHAQIVTSLPDSIHLMNPAVPFSGLILVEDWLGNRISNYLFQKGQQPLMYSYTNPPTKSPASTIGCTAEITGYNYPADNPDAGYQWSEPTPCMGMYVSDNLYTADLGAGDYAGTGGGSGSTSTTPTNLVSVAPGPSIIGNIQDFMKCFTNYSGTDHSYSVMVCVDQPAPGTRTPWGFTSDGISGSSNAGNPFDVGHTFLIFSENFSDHSIVRNVGFYPSSNVGAYSQNSQGQLNNNEAHGYDISGSFAVTNNQFFNMLSYVELGNNTGYMYNLSSNNCTTFAIHTLGQGGITLPSTIGSWSVGMGNDPGDLGEDLRSRSIPGMTLSTVFNHHPNQGFCQ